MQVTSAMALGITESHLAALAQDQSGDATAQLHVQVVTPWQGLKTAAGKAGFDLHIASGFRSFERQLAIWNGKASGQRPILDSDGQPLDRSSLTEKQLVWAILRWSALPGASRHHWGTDVDVWDRAAVSPGYALQLTAEEYGPQGPFAALSEWLTEHMGEYGFYRPYEKDFDGVAPEPWHLSYRPVAEIVSSTFQRRELAELLQRSDLLLKDTVLKHLDEIIDRFMVLG